MRFFLLLAPTIALVVYGQIMSKWRVGELMSRGALGTSVVDRLLGYLHDPIVLSGYAAAFLSSLTWLIVIEKYPLSYAFPIYIGLVFACVALGSALILGEHLSVMRLVSIALILLGIVIGSVA